MSRIYLNKEETTNHEVRSGQGKKRGTIKGVSLVVISGKKFLKHLLTIILSLNFCFILMSTLELFFFLSYLTKLF